MNNENTISLGALLQAMRERETKTCAHCGKQFVGVLIATYCSARCRNAATYARRKADRKAKRNNAEETTK